jgi:outer membrane protein OmpA-like peptidoglycan-associated protein
MTTSLRFLALTGACLLWAASAGAQSSASQQQSSDNSSSETRPATTTFLGDTGLWFVPTAEVLAHGKWSVSGYRRGTNFKQGFTNVSDVAGTFGVGLGGRTEIFGSFLFDTRIDRDVRPIFTTDQETGGIVHRYPGVREVWTGDNVGDFYVGAKFNLWSEYQQKPAALAVRGILKLPTGDEDAGVTTGSTDFLVDFIASKELSRLVEVSGHAGWEFLGSPDDFELPGGAFRWGAGAAIGQRSPLRGTFELTGSALTDDVATITGLPLVGTDGSISPLVSAADSVTRFTAGLTWQSRNGFFVGGGLSWNFPTEDRTQFGSEGDEFGDFADWQIRIGFHPGVRRYVPPPPPPPPPPTPTPQPQANRPPTVQARCEPCTIEVGRSVTVTADAKDPDGDPLTYRWSAPAGTFQNAADRQTLWTAPQQEGPVQVTVTVNDGRGGTASSQVVIQVIRPAPVVELKFEDVYFDFDRSTLRPEALRLLDDAVTKLQASPGRSMVIEGHTCNIGTAEYNLALGERRATSVRDYLISRGVPAARLQGRSYGEERPRHDNAREETRRLNRRAALVVSVQ